MNALELWIHSPGAKALAWTLFHFLWEAVLIAALLVLMLAALKHASSRARYAAASVALAAMALAFVGTLAVEWPRAAAQISIPLQPSSFAPAITGATFPNHLPAPGFRLTDGLAWAPALWLAGVALLFMYRLGSWTAAQRLRRVGAYAAPEAWLLQLRHLAASLGVTRPVALMESCLTEVPIMIGYLKPVIVMPIGLLAGLPPEQVEAILLHELAHIGRADYLVNILQTGIEGLLFYHPAVWWVSAVMRAERENCCDDTVVALQGNAHQYAAALFTVEQKRGSVPQPILAANGGSLPRRIRRLLGRPDARDLAMPVFPAALLVISTAVALAAWQPATPPKPPIPPPAQQSVPPAPPAVPPVPASTAPAVPPTPPVPALSSTSPDTPPPPPPPLPPAGRGQSYAASVQFVPTGKSDSQVRSGETYTITVPYFEDGSTAPKPEPYSDSYRQWLRDVSFIISPAEQRAVIKLTTEAQRSQYIEQFWSRRNPAGAAPNAYRDEYYRRLATAQAKYTQTTPAGAPTQTLNAMGRAYVQYGPPDQIDDRALSPNPSQIWRYNHVPGFRSNVELEFIKVGNTYTQRINWPPPAYIFTGNAAAAPDLQKALSQELHLDAAAAAQTSAGLPEHASIRIYAGQNTVILNVPLSSFTGRVDVIGSISPKSESASDLGAGVRLSVANVRDYIDALKGTWETNFTLTPGNYTARVLAREVSSGKMYTEQIDFEVK
jgi:GWxTD domain-containing protein